MSIKYYYKSTYNYNVKKHNEILYKPTSTIRFDDNFSFGDFLRYNDLCYVYDNKKRTYHIIRKNIHNKIKFTGEVYFILFEVKT